ncbi:MAG: glycoside hydrolase family 27 protein, partial [Planctomycetota bacterium]
MSLPPPHWPPRGWNSFDSFGAVADERAILDNLDVLIERLLPHGYDTHVLDIGWYRRYHREPGQRFPQVSEATLLGHELDDVGRYLPCPTMFPNGVKPLADACHERGVHFGIHLMRGIPRVAVERDLPISGAEGLRASDIADTSDVCPWCDDNVGVDMRRPGAQAYYDSVFRLLAEWGVDYVKVDDIVPYP